MLNFRSVHGKLIIDKALNGLIHRIWVFQPSIYLSQEDLSFFKFKLFK